MWREFPVSRFPVPSCVRGFVPLILSTHGRTFSRSPTENFSESEKNHRRGDRNLQSGRKPRGSCSLWAANVKNSMKRGVPTTKRLLNGGAAPAGCGRGLQKGDRHFSQGLKIPGHLASKFRCIGLCFIVEQPLPCRQDLDDQPVTDDAGFLTQIQQQQLGPFVIPSRFDQCADLAFAGA